MEGVLGGNSVPLAQFSCQPKRLKKKKEKIIKSWLEIWLVGYE